MDGERERENKRMGGSAHSSLLVLTPSPFHPFAFSLLLLVLMFFIADAGYHPARAAPPPPATPIGIPAEVEFALPPTTPGSATNVFRRQSNLVRAFVAGPDSFALTDDNVLTLSAGNTAAFRHRLAYSGAADVSATLTFANAAGDDYDLLNLRAYQDLNTNGVFDAAEPEISYGGAITLQPDVPFDIVVLGTVPSSGVSAGQVGSVFVSASVAGLAGNLGATNRNSVTIVASAGALFVELTASKQRVEIGDFIQYTLRVRNASGIDLDGIVVTNDLPFGFGYDKGSLIRDGTSTVDPAGGAGPRLKFNIGRMTNDTDVTLTYRVRARPGATKGDGVARARAASATPRVFVSNLAVAKVNVKQGGVFTDDGVAIGKVFIDSNQNRQQDADEIGIPGVRIYMEDGTYVITDSEGKYNFYGLKPKTHVFKVDETTLPEGAELLAPSTRHAGSGSTRFVDINRGELHKADFTVGYATPEFVQAVKQRRLRSERGVSEIDSTIKGRLTPDGAPLVTADPKSLPASGLISATPNGGPSLTSGLVPQTGRRPVTGSTAIVSTNVAAVPNTNSVAPALRALETELAQATNNTLAFFDLRDGDTLPTRQAAVRVKGPRGGKLSLVVNGAEVSGSRLGRRAALADKEVEAWEFVGVEFISGTNRLEAVFLDPFGNERERRVISVIAPDKLGRIRILLPKEDPVADGKTPVKIIVTLTDGNGVPVTARTPLTLEASLGQWQTPDLDKTEPGLQVFLDGGRGEVTLLPPLEPGENRLRVSSGILQAEAPMSFVPDLREMLAVGVVEGTINLSRLDGAAFQTSRSQDGFEEELQSFGLNGGSGNARTAGRAAFFLKGKILGKYLLTAGYDSEKDTRERLFRDIQPDEFYPVYGDSSVKGFDAQTTGKLYVRVDRQRSYLLYGDFTTQSGTDVRSLGNYNRSLTGLKSHLENRWSSVNLWASEDSTRQVIDEFRANGTSGPYRFKNRNGLLNSEKVEIITRDRNQPSLILQTELLARFTDYEFEPFTGQLLLRRPVPSLDPFLNPIYIRVTYEVDQGGEKFWVYGADGQVKVTSQLELGGAVIRDENPLGSYGLYSGNATLKLSEKTFLIGEVARSETDTTDGNAGRLELRHQDAKSDLRVYYGQAGTTFSNSAAIISAGRVESGLNGSYRVASNTRLVGQAIQSENISTDGERRGATLSVEQTFAKNVKLELGGRYSTETTTPASGSTAAPPGITPNEIASVRGKLTLPVPFVKNASLYGEIENDVEEVDKRMIAFGGEYHWNSKTRLYARHELINAIGGPFELNNFQQQNTTVFGLQTEYMKDGNIFNEYRGRDAFAGREAEAAIGLRNGWNLAEGLRLNTTIERVTPIEGAAANEATAGAFGLEYTRNPDWKATARVELRTSPNSDSLLNTLGYARKVNADWTWLTKTIFYGVENTGASDSTKTQARFQTGLAYRQTDRDRLHGLLRYELKHESDSLEVGADQDRLVHILSTHLNYQPTRDWILSTHVASKIAFDDVDGSSSTYNANLVALRATYDLTKRLDVGVNGSMLFDGELRSIQFGLGPELGWTFKNNMRVAAGFNIFGFKDEDLAKQDYTNPGFFLSLRWKFDESMFGLGNNSKEKSKP